jgi:hypothetical protein
MTGKAFGRSLKPGEGPGKSLGGGCVSDTRTPGGHTAEERKPQSPDLGRGVISNRLGEVPIWRCPKKPLESDRRFGDDRENTFPRPAKAAVAGKGVGKPVRLLGQRKENPLLSRSNLLAERVDDLIQFFGFVFSEKNSAITFFQTVLFVRDWKWVCCECAAPINIWQAQLFEL